MDDEIESLIQRCRKGDRIEIDRLSELATNMRELQERLERLHARGAWVVDREGRRSDRPEAIEMIFEASSELKKGPPVQVSRENGEKSDGRPPKQRETPKEVAERNWFDSRYKTDQEAIDASPGWNKSVMRYHFGASGRQRGGDRKSKKVRKK
jgi:hypothetical protein